MDSVIPSTLLKKGLDDIDAIAKSEYGVPFEEILSDDNPNRLERIAGILIKRPFASVRERGSNDPFSETGAHTIWIWDIEKLKEGVSEASIEYELLSNLCKPGSWHDDWNVESGTSWETFTDDVDLERGLFKIIALYLKDKLDKEGSTKTIAAYYNAEESRTFKKGLDLVNILANAGIVGPIVSIVGVPGLAVSLALFIAEFGAERLFDREKDKIGDNGS